MREKVEKFYIPEYVREFKCSMCGECCTNKWGIDFGNSDYRELDKNFSSVGNSLDNYIFKKENRYHFKMLNGYCNLICKDGQCGIQRDFGWESLPNVCKTYPRIVHSTDRGVEVALKFSCKTAAASLLKKDKFRLIEVTPDEFFMMIPKKMMYIRAQNAFTGTINHNYYLLEKNLLSLVKREDILYSEKKLGIFNYIETLLDLEKKEELPKDENQWSMILEDILTSPGEKKEITFDDFLVSIKNSESEMKDEVVFVLENSIKVIESQLKKNEKLNWKNFDYLKKLYILEENEFILENYLYNLIFSKEIFTDKRYGIFYIFLLEFFLKILIVSHSIELGRALTPQEIIDSVVKTDHLLAHSSKTVKTIWDNFVVSSTLNEAMEKVYFFARN